MLMLYFTTVTEPVITRQPVSVRVAIGANASFTVEASGGGLSYQWFGPGGEALIDSDREIEGSNSPSLQIMNVVPDDAGNYSVRVENAAGSVDSDEAFLTIGEPFVLHIKVNSHQVVKLGREEAFNYCKLTILWLALRKICGIAIVLYNGVVASSGCHIYMIF